MKKIPSVRMLYRFYMREIGVLGKSFAKAYQNGENLHKINYERNI